MTIEAVITEAVRQVVRDELAELREEVRRLRAEYREEAVSIDEAARRLHISTKTVRRRIASGTLPAIRLGSKLRVQLGRALGDAPDPA